MNLSTAVAPAAFRHENLCIIRAGLSGSPTIISAILADHVGPTSPEYASSGLERTGDGELENDTLVLLVMYRNGDVHGGVSCARFTARILVFDHLYRHSRRNHCLAGFEAVRGVRKEVRYLLFHLIPILLMIQLNSVLTCGKTLV